MSSPPDRAGSYLLVKEDPSVVYELQSVLRFGRSSRSDVVLKSQRASRHHAEIRALRGGKYCVWDSGSRNGTFVNGERITGSRVLHNGDEVSVASRTFIFCGEATAETTLVTDADSAMGETDVGLEERVAVTLVSDIRKYTTMSEKYGREFQTFVAEWFRSVVGLVQRQRGIVDKIHGDGLLAYWWVPEDAAPTEVIKCALQTCDGMMSLKDEFAARLGQEMPEEHFDIGLGVHMGGILLGNLGTGSVHAFTAVGDAVNVTFRLEELTKSVGYPVLVSDVVHKHAPEGFTFVDKGAVSIRGWSGRLGIWSLEGYRQRPVMHSEEDDTVPTEEVTDARMRLPKAGGALEE